MSINIYISSLAFGGKEPEEIIAIAREHDWAIEFSSGMGYKVNMKEIFRDALIKRMPHNYFPAPKEPFVLNLASSNNLIRSRSVQHCKELLFLAKQSGAPFYAAHAGFCIDPNPDELGKRIVYDPVFKREDHQNIFIESLNSILTIAEELEIDFLIENNVIAAFNMINETINPLLCCDGQEINWLFRNIKHKRFGLLLDTAHLKISCQTLHLSITEELAKIASFVKAVHHSESNGIEDNNEPITTDYWFLPFLHQYRNIAHVIEVKNIDEYQIRNQITILQEAYGC